jgi:NTP pyrophosphatase (non-canonical NTP hydrolase)
MLNFDTYQEQAWETAQYPQSGANMVYPALGLAGEAGEVAEKVKKAWRNQGITNGALVSDSVAIEIAKELSDVLWYVSALAKELNIPLADIAQMNLDKLHDRNKRGVIKSEGDNR